MCHFGIVVKLVLSIDAKATEHILHRQGVGRTNHMDMAHVWLQDEVGSNRLVVRRVSSDQNVAGLGTIALGPAAIARHAEPLGNTNMSCSH